MKKIVFITSYPEKGLTHGKKTVGVASYAKNTVNSIRNLDNKSKIFVLAEKLDGQAQNYRENGINIVRCWKRNSLLFPFQIVSQLIKIKPNISVLEYEMAMLGNPIMNVFVPCLLIVSKVMKTKNVIVIHQVVDNFSQMHGHMGMKKDSTKIKLLNIVSRIFYKIILTISDKAIVFEEFLKERLSEHGNADRICVIPHGVEKIQNIPSKQKARKQLGISNDELVLISFGYLAWYKGSDWLAKKADKLIKKNKKIRVIFAGGPNPNHADKEHYNSYISKINHLADRSNGKLSITGYVEEKDISIYYSASDLVVLPYRANMSSSGPLSICFSTGKPFLISKPLSPYNNTADFANSLTKSSLNMEDLTFSLSGNDFENKIIKLHNDRLKLNKIEMISSQLAKSRSWENIAKEYLTIFD